MNDEEIKDGFGGDTGNDIPIDIEIPSAQKPLRKLKRLTPSAPAKRQEEQVYHGLHEAPQSDEPVDKAEQEKLRNYHGKHEAEPEDAGTKETNGFSWKDFTVKFVAIALSLAVIVVLILTMPIIWFNDKRTGTKKNVSLLYYLKNEQFLGYIEGNIDKTKNDPQINTDVVEPDYNDGLDLPQKVEGQFTLLFLGFDEDVSNTDVMWVLEFDIRAGKLNILQIPRDTFMPDYTGSASGRANSVYRCGREEVNPPIQRVVDAVEQNFGIPIDAYVTTVCTDIVHTVDLIGGIPMHLDEEIVYEGGKVIPAGDIVLNGQQSEWFIRFRHDWLEGDIGRVKNQRRFMAAAMRKLIDIADGGKGHTQLYKYLMEIYKHEWIATDMSVGDLTKLADFAGTLEMENVLVNMVPGEGTPNEHLYVGVDGNQYSVYSIHKQAAIDMLNKYFRPYQKRMTNSTTTIVELIKDHAYDFYDDTSSSLAELENSTEPQRNP
ncbi:MAG: LCP family protein [Ruminococcus sp.]|nr:LCP family protein [Ruminococcus sp.]